MTYGMSVCDVLVMIGVTDGRRSTKTRLARTAWNGGGIQVPFPETWVMNHGPAMPLEVGIASVENRLGWGRDINALPWVTRPSDCLPCIPVHMAISFGYSVGLTLVIYRL